MSYVPRWRRPRRKASSNPRNYRYSTAPSACRCEKCGFVLEMKGKYAGKHCPQIPCPRCAGRMWRVK